MTAALRFLAREDGTFHAVRTPRAPLAWQCHDGPDPMPKWYRLGEGFGPDRNGQPRLTSTGMLPRRMLPEYLIGACYREALEAGLL